MCICCDFSQETIRKCQKMILVWGVILFFLAAGMVYFWSLFMKIDVLEIVPFTVQEDYTVRYNLFQVLTLLTFIVVGATVVFAIWTITVTCKPNKWCLGPFAILEFVVSLGLGYIALVMVFQGVIASEGFINKACNATNFDDVGSMKFGMQKLLFANVQEVDNRL